MSFFRRAALRPSWCIMDAIASNFFHSNILALLSTTSLDDAVTAESVHCNLTYCWLESQDKALFVDDTVSNEDKN